MVARANAVRRKRIESQITKSVQLARASKKKLAAHKEAVSKLFSAAAASDPSGGESAAAAVDNCYVTNEWLDYHFVYMSGGRVFGFLKLAHNDGVSEGVAHFGLPENFSVPLESLSRTEDLAKPHLCPFCGASVPDGAFQVHVLLQEMLAHRNTVKASKNASGEWMLLDENKWTQTLIVKPEVGLSGSIHEVLINSGCGTSLTADEFSDRMDALSSKLFAIINVENA